VASNKRERELARMRAERQAARRAAMEAQHRQRRNTLLIVLSAVAAVAVIAVTAVVVGTGDDTKTTVTPTSSASASTTAYGNLGGTGTCKYTKSGDAAKKISGLPPTSKIRTTGTQTATIVTTQGTVKATLLTSKAPCTVNSFVFLSQQKYFDETPCPRIVTSGIFVLQCGDPTGTTSGGPGYQFDDENLEGATYPAGTLAMANGGPGTNGSQFFLVYKDTQLPASYTPFGKITAGIDVLEKVAKGGDDGSNSAGGGKPKIAISLAKVTVS
jgi:peptidyl-prolyl cis-trans isomerase B (cyclophilin B)